MVRQQTNPVVSNYVKIPKDILQLNHSVAADVMFVNGMGLLVSISSNIKFTMVQYIWKKTMGNISKSLENINEVYARCRMFVEMYYMDREFEKLRGVMPGKSRLNTTTTSHHVQET